MGRELFHEIVEAPGEARVLGGLDDLFTFHHLPQERVQRTFPVLFTQGRGQHVDLLQAGLLERGLIEQRFGVQLDPLAVDVKKPERGLAVVLGE